MNRKKGFNSLSERLELEKGRKFNILHGDRSTLFKNRTSKILYLICPKALR